MLNEKMKKIVSGKVAVAALIAVLAATTVTACSTDVNASEAQNIGIPSLSQVGYGEGSEGAGEHGGFGEAGSETAGEHGRFGESGSEGAVTVSQGAQEGSTGESSASEEAGTEYALDDVYDEISYGARMMMAYDANSNAFVGAVVNTTNSTLPRVRVEVHQSNGIELGPTNPVDLAPGQAIRVVLPATGEFDGWTTHAEVGNLEHGSASAGSEAGGEHGGFSGSEGTGEYGGFSGGEGAGEHGGLFGGSEAGGEHGGFGESGRGG